MTRRLAWTSEAWSDSLYWQRQDRKTLKRINALIDAASREPFSGIGKPEPLRENLAGFWSRRRMDSRNWASSAGSTAFPRLASHTFSSSACSWVRW